MRPTPYTLNVYRGDGYRWKFVLWADEEKQTPIDLTGIAVKSEIRDRSAGKIVVPLDCTIEPPNVIVALLKPNESARLKSPACVWDLRLTYPTGHVRTILGGSVAVRADVTDSSPGVSPHE
jgi:hypothetical protein